MAVLAHPPHDPAVGPLERVVGPDVQQLCRGSPRQLGRRDLPGGLDGDRGRESGGEVDGLELYPKSEW